MNQQKRVHLKLIGESVLFTMKNENIAKSNEHANRTMEMPFSDQTRLLILHWIHRAQNQNKEMLQYSKKQNSLHGVDSEFKANKWKTNRNSKKKILEKSLFKQFFSFSSNASTKTIAKWQFKNWIVNICIRNFGSTPTIPNKFVFDSFAE